MKRTTAVLVSAALVSVAFVGFDAASYAANGKSLLLGKSNTASKTTTIKRTNAGPVLELKGKPSAPPLKVSSSKKVAKLNADSVDGLSASALGLRATRYQIPSTTGAGGSVSFLLTGVKPGNYLVTKDLVISSTSANSRCFLVLGNGDNASVSYGVKVGTFANNSGAGVITVPAGTLTLTCNTEGFVTLKIGVEPSFVSFLPLASLKTVSPDNTPVARVKPAKKAASAGNR